MHKKQKISRMTITTVAAASVLVATLILSAVLPTAPVEARASTQSSHLHGSCNEGNEECIGGSSFTGNNDDSHINSNCNDKRDSNAGLCKTNSFLH